VVKREHWSTACLVATLVVSLVSCREEPLPVPPQVAGETDLDEVRAAVLLRLHAEAVRIAPSVKVMCVAVEQGEASARLLTRLSGRGLTLRKPSCCAVRGRRIVDPFSGADAVTVGVSRVTLVAPGEALAEGGYELGPLDGRGTAYRLEFRWGRWEIVEERETWVS